MTQRKTGIKEGQILFPKNSSGYPARKEFLNEYNENKQLVSYIDLFPTKASTEKLYAIFDNQKVFTNPKLQQLIEWLIKVTMNSGIVLDFFAGSGTTAHAVMSLNAEAALNGDVFIDGWTTSLSSTLEHYKENVKIVF